MRVLTPCVACGRHVASSEVACPFCDATLTPSAARALDPTTRLGRAALFAFGATTAAALSTLTACGDDRASPPPTTVAPPPTTIAPPDTSVAAPYGAPPPPPITQAPPASETAPESHHRPHRPPHTGVVQPYGAPPEPGVHALYGGPGLGD